MHAPKDNVLDRARALYAAHDYAACRFMVSKALAAGMAVVEERAEALYLLGNLSELDDREGAAVSAWLDALRLRQRPDAHADHPIYLLIDQAIQGIGACPRLLVSYASADRAVAGRLREGLESTHALSCIDYARDFPAAGTVSGVITDALDRASSMAVVWSATYAASRYCRAELLEAYRRAHLEGYARHLFVVRIDGTPLPLELEDQIWLDVIDDASLVEAVRQIAFTLQMRGGIGGMSRVPRSVPLP